MRTKSDAEVKHSQRRERGIHHCSRATRETFSMPDERDDALEPALADGRYDAFILSAEARDNGIALSCAITIGPHRGDVVDLVSTTLTARDPFALLGLPCTLVVEGDTIRVES
jgi:hypothetical protein